MSASVMCGKRGGDPAVGGRSARVVGAFGLVAVVVAMLWGVAPAGAADFTWSADPGARGPDPTTGSHAPPARWSNGSSWAGGVAPSGSVGTLSFPAEDCYGGGIRFCPVTDNDISGLTASNLALSVPGAPGAGWGLGASTTHYPFTPLPDQRPLTLSSGLSAVYSSAPVSQSPVTLGKLGIPIVLGGPNTWTIGGSPDPEHGEAGEFTVLGTVSGDQPWTVDLRQGAQLHLQSAGNSFGDVAISGSDEKGKFGGYSYANGKFILDSRADLNGGNGRSVSVSRAALDVFGGATIGALRTTAAEIVIADYEPDHFAQVGPPTASSVAFDADTTVEFRSQLSATGPVDLGGATACPSTNPGAGPVREPGDVLTLISTTGTVSGRFAKDTVTQYCGTPATFKYTEHTVTATIGKRPAPVAPVDAVSKPTGPDAKIARVLANGGYQFTFQGAQAGVMRVRWYQVPRGARLAAARKRPKPLAIASGSTRTKLSRSATLKVKLGARGRKLLKRTKNKVKLTSVVEYTPDGHKKARKVTKFKLKH